MSAGSQAEKKTGGAGGDDQEAVHWVTCQAAVGAHALVMHVASAQLKGMLMT